MNLNWRFWLRVVIVVLILYSFFRTGLSLEYVIILGIIFVLIIFLRGKLYRKINQLMTKHFKFLSTARPWVKKLIIILVFIIIYLILREGVFLVLKLAGVDVQKILVESMNQSVNVTG